MSVKEIKSKSEFDALLASGKVIFVDFYTDWCGPCKVISPEFEAHAKGNTQEGAEFYKIDIDKVKELANELNIRSIPTFHVYRNGERIDETVGANRSALKTLVQTNLALA